MHSQSRRSVLGLVAGVTSLAATASPSLAAYGDAANVFGKVTNRSGEQPAAVASATACIVLPLVLPCEIQGAHACACIVCAARCIACIKHCKPTDSCTCIWLQAPSHTQARALQCCCHPSGTPPRRRTLRARAARQHSGVGELAGCTDPSYMLHVARGPAEVPEVVLGCLHVLLSQQVDGRRMDAHSAVMLARKYSAAVTDRNTSGVTTSALDAALNACYAVTLHPEVLYSTGVAGLIRLLACQILL